jgi:hypothetical protein
MPRSEVGRPSTETVEPPKASGSRFTEELQQTEASTDKGKQREVVQDTPSKNSSVSDFIAFTAHQAETPKDVKPEGVQKPTVTERLGNALNDMKEGIKKIPDAVQESVPKSLQEARDSVEAFGRRLGTRVKEIRESFNTTLSDAKEYAKPRIDQLKASTTEALTEAKDAAKKFGRYLNDSRPVTKEYHEQTINNLKEHHEQMTLAAKEHRAEMTLAAKEHHEQMTLASKEHRAEMTQASKEHHAKTINNLEKYHAQMTNNLEKHHAETINNLEKHHEQMTQTLNEQTAKRLDDLEKQLKTMQAALESMQQEKQAQSLSAPSSASSSKWFS